MKIRWIFIIVLVWLTSCGKQIPDHVITPDKMEDVLYDYHLAMAMSNDLKNGEKVAYKKYVFKKHRITEAEFDSSMVWYTRETKLLYAMYGKLNKRFNREYNNVEMKLESRQEASTYEYESGDSINIWHTRNLAWMSESPLHHLLSFEIKPDTTFHDGDAFLWEADFHFTTKGNVIMGINMTDGKDLVIGKTLEVDSSGHQSIYLHTTDTAFQIKALNGYIFVPKDSTSNTHVLVHNIALKRYHSTDSLLVKKHNIPEKKMEVKPKSGKKKRPTTLTQPMESTPKLEKVEPMEMVIE